MTFEKDNASSIMSSMMAASRNFVTSPIQVGNLKSGSMMRGYNAVRLV